MASDVVLAPSRGGASTTRRWLGGTRNVIRVGPAFVAAIAYVDPGNIATNSAAGSQYGYALLWVVLVATATAGPMQYLSAKLAAVTGHSLPELMHDRLGRRSRLAYWMQAEVVAVATDIAEVIGAAVALHLLFGVSLLTGGVLAGVFGMALLLIRDALGPAVLESISTLSLVVIGGGFLLGLIAAPPTGHGLLGGLAPTVTSSQQLLLAAGIVGATIMPHAIYLHSGLASDPARRSVGTAGLLRSHRRDVCSAMVLAGGINVAMLVLGATALHGSSDSDFGNIASALTNRLGPAVTTAFLAALLVSGLTSTAVGTAAGETIMSGLLRRRISPFARRSVTLVPALLLLASGLSPVSVLVLSQVLLSIGLPFALVPLVQLTSSRRVMGCYANHAATKAFSWIAVTSVVILDVGLVLLTLKGML